MKVATGIQYIADDGTVFNDEAACLTYEIEAAETAKNTTYWYVTFNPDLTEGRGYYGYAAFQLRASYMAKEFMEDFCFERYGRRVAFVQGASPMPNWYLTKIEKDVFDRPVGGSVGDSKVKGNKYLLKFGKNKLEIDKEI
jgi:hypothetical protein